jgi:hypothetical protein
MIHLILASSAQSLRGLTLQLEKLTIKDIDGENVADYVSFARGAIEQLRNNNALPIDVLTILVDALKVSSTESFNAFVTSMYNNHVQGVKSVTAEDVLRAAEEEYINLTSGLKWNAGTLKKDQESIFFAGKCNACGMQGHIAANCRQQQVKEVMPEEEAVVVVVAVAAVEVDAISTEAEAVAAVVVVDFTEEDFAMIAIHLKLENLKRG